jgi:hypothetical protein
VSKPVVTRARRAGALAAVAAVMTGCGVAAQQSGQGGGSNGAGRPSQSDGIPVFHAHPQAVSPIAEGASASESPGGVSVSTPPSGSLPQPVSLAQVKAQLARSGLSATNHSATVTPNGLAIAPLTAPPQIQEVIDAGNEIAHLPYIWGGGHGRFVDTGYDCSGSLSFIFAAAGILSTTMTSGEFAKWGDPGPGKWITIFANNGHTFAYIAGLRFDTVALAQTGTRWSAAPGGPAAGDGNGFAIRHPPGL